MPGESGEVSVDQYHRYKEDISLMASLGFKSYRFSISWSRLLPTKSGPVNEQGIAYYRNLCIELKNHGIQAAATLYHWDLPQYLQDEGGWTNREISFAFLDFAKLCFDRFGDLVDQWFTLNEPYCSAYLGYEVGRHAPGIMDPDMANRAVHHLNLAHGLAVSAFRETELKTSIGIVLNPNKPRPATRRAEDFHASEVACAYETDVFLHPILGKGYPELVTQELGIHYPIEEGDMDIISTPVDFLGINYYFENAVAYAPSKPRQYGIVPNWQHTTDMGWPVVPKGLLRLLTYIDEQSNGIPIYITENGCACPDVLEADGRIHDRQRCDYLLEHIGICKQAIEKNINLKGYFVWSFIDNFEWAYGYSKRFGIIYADYANLQRIPKDSAYLMRDIIAGYM